MNGITATYEQAVGYLSEQVFQAAPYRVLFALLLLLVLLVARRVAFKYVLRMVTRMADKTSMRYDDMLIQALKRPFSAAWLLTAWYAALIIMVQSSSFDYYAGCAFKTVLAAIIAWAFWRLIDVLALFLRTTLSRTGGGEDQIIPVITRSLKIFLLIIAAILIVQNLGYSASSLLAGLGIGGITVALAAKDTVANLFASMTIFLDKPFMVGDWIKCGDVEGIVEAVGFRSTKIRTFDKSLLAIPNSQLADQAINNFSRMTNRRVAATIPIAYGAGREQLNTLKQEILSLLAGQQGVKQDSSAVYFTGFGDRGLELLVFYLTDTTKWSEYISIKEAVNFHIMRLLEETGLQTATAGDVYLKHSPEALK